MVTSHLFNLNTVLGAPHRKINDSLSGENGQITVAARLKKEASPMQDVRMDVSISELTTEKGWVFFVISLPSQDYKSLCQPIFKSEVMKPKDGKVSWRTLIIDLDTLLPPITDFLLFQLFKY
jgi:hypothetical protein